MVVYGIIYIYFFAFPLLPGCIIVVNFNQWLVEIILKARKRMIHTMHTFCRSYLFYYWMIVL